MIGGIVTRQLVNFPVAILLGLSGYFAAASNITTFGAVAQRSWRLALPYLVAVVVFTVFRDPSLLAKPRYMAMMTLTGRATLVGYFVPLLIQFVILTPFLASIQSLRWHCVIMLGLSAVGLIWTYGWQVFAPQSQLASFPFNVLPFFVWFPFYHLGFVLKRYPAPLQIPMPPGTVLAALGLLLACTMVEAFLVWPDNTLMATSQTKLSSKLLSAFLLVLTIRSCSNQTSQPQGVATLLAQIGKASYFIYLYHMLVATRVTDMARQILTLESAALIVAVPSVAIGLLLCSYVLKRTLGATWAAKLFGTG